MRSKEDSDVLAPVLWIRATESDIELAAFAPRSGGVRMLDAATAPDSLVALARDPERARAVVIVESGVRGFDALCERLSAMAPAPRVVIVYPRMRVLRCASRMPDMARSSMRAASAGE